jgi:hypothetical protein
MLKAPCRLHIELHIDLSTGKRHLERGYSLEYASFRFIAHELLA